MAAAYTLDSAWKKAGGVVINMKIIAVSHALKIKFVSSLLVKLIGYSAVA